MELRFGAPRYDAMLETGHGLDAIGVLSEVELPRNDGETDQAYRERLIVKLDWLCGVEKAVSLPDMNEFGKYRIWLETSTPVALDGLPYLVQQVGFENGRFWARLSPSVPLQLVSHEWHGPTIHLFAGKQGDESRLLATVPIESTADTKPRENHVRDAVRANH